MNQLTLISQVKELKDTLATIQPQSETAQLITYTLIGAALMGIMVYHYVKEQESL